MISRVLSSELPLYSVDAGMVIFVILVPLKASLPIDVTDEGMVSAPVNEEQPEKAPLPIDVTDEPMVSAPVNEEQPKKA